MVTVFGWDVFVDEVIKKDAYFYFYAASKICSKILETRDLRCLGVIDQNAQMIDDVCGVPCISREVIERASEDEINILCCLNPLNKYNERFLEVKQFLDIKKNVKLYQLDIKSIKEKGYIDWAGEKVLVDYTTFVVGGNLEYISRVYGNRANIKKYMLCMNDEPYEMSLCNGQIGLRNFDNGYIKHENGRKNPKLSLVPDGLCRRVFLYGDSRVSGWLIENNETIAAYMQRELLDMYVINCGMPGRDIERMVYQIQNTDIAAGDVVIMATGFYEYDDDIQRNLLTWIEFIADANNVVKSHNAIFMYVNIPTMFEVGRLTDEEYRMRDDYQVMKSYTNYSSDYVRYYKSYMKWLCMERGITFLDMADPLANSGKEFLFLDIHHFGPAGYEVIAKELVKYVRFTNIENSGLEIEEALVEKEKREQLFRDKIKALCKENEDLETYLDSVRERMKEMKTQSDNPVIGAIVMNANPFTLGHQYLVETSLQEVDGLICFVVEEDDSFFPFKERIEIVSENLKEYPNVIVVPSGKYCISKFTFPDYFKKSEKQGKHIDVSMDVFLFAEVIAPKLNISVRFVGTEPEDAVTRQYNESMRKAFQRYGIKFIEIERKKRADGVISASLVRGFLSKKKYDEIQKYVSPKTYDLIMDFVRKGR